jgi:hypothetical protein
MALWSLKKVQTQFYLVWVNFVDFISFGEISKFGLLKDSLRGMNIHKQERRKKERKKFKY